MSQNLLAILLTLFLATSHLMTGKESGGTGPSVAPPNASGTPAATGTATIVGDRVAMHSAPGSGVQVSTLRAGDEVEIVGQQGDWYRIRTGDGQSGYVASFTLVPGSVAVRAARRGAAQVVAYYDAAGSLSSLETHFATMDAISPWAWQIDADGSLIPRFNEAGLSRGLRFAGEKGLKSLALIHNYRRMASGREGFDPLLAHQILADPTVRRRAIANIAAAVQRWGMSGVQVDLENVPPGDRENLTRFMAELSAALKKQGLSVTMAVPAKTRDIPSSTWSGAFDYAALAPHVDRLMLMTYDENHPGGPPGPVASVGWVERVIRYTLSVDVPASKVVLGLPAYGYDWAPDGSARAVTYSEARRLSVLHQAKIEWDEAAKVPFIRYKGHQVWFEDRYSASHKLALVNKYGLGGVAVWRLGQEDPGLWEAITDLLR